MLQTAFLTVAGHSLQAAVVILAVLLMRFVLRRMGAPAAVSYALWAVVLFRLLCPVSPESPVGLVPAEMADLPTQYAAEISGEAWLDSGAVMPNEMPEGNPDRPYVEYTIPAVTQRRAMLQSVSGVLWAVGMAVMVLYSVVAYCRLRRKLVGAMPLEGNIRLADHISSPFVLGLFRPNIYLPSSLSEREREYILLHERHHIRRLDHVIKILAFAALCIHWFNPLVWLAFYLSGQDMEMSCDEAVVKKLGGSIRAEYSASLLNLSTGRTVIAATPLAFGEGNTGGRIKNLAKWKKPALWITVAAVILCAAVIVLCATNAKPSADQTDLPQQTAQPTPPPRGFGPDMIYVPERCLYMNSLSSFLAMGGDNGWRYRMGDGGFYQIRQDTGATFALAEGYGWVKWEEFPWSDAEWEALFWPEGMWKVDVSGYEKREYCALSQGNCLLRMDGELWLVDISEDNKIGTNIWSIYLLVPQNTKGSAQWEYAPVLSSRVPYFRFRVDVEYDEILAHCTAGKLMFQGCGEDEIGQAVTVPAGQALYWSPLGEEGGCAEQCTLSIAVQKDGVTACFATVYLRGDPVKETGHPIYTAHLVGTGLIMEQDPDFGAVIRIK